MRAHIIHAGKVSNTIEVESLSFLPGLLDASLGGQIGDLWDGTVFSKPPRDVAAEKAAANAIIMEKLAANDLTIVRALVENDASRIAAFKATQAALRAQLSKE
jgi:hypothetical protein